MPLHVDMGLTLFKSVRRQCDLLSSSKIFCAYTKLNWERRCRLEPYDSRRGEFEEVPQGGTMIPV